MKRRTLLAAVGGLGFSVRQAVAQANRLPLIAVLWHAGSRQEEGVLFDALMDGFKSSGYEEGKTARFEHRYPNEQAELFSRYANELVELGPDLIVAVTSPAALAAKAATKKIPIVFVVVPDPLNNGVVDQLNRPSENITGLSSMASELTAKRVSLLIEAVPAVTKVALLVNASDTKSTSLYIAATRAITQPGIVVEPVAIRRREDVETGYREILDRRFNGIVMTQDGLLYAERQKICDLAIAAQIPLSGASVQTARSGALMSYGPDIIDVFRRAGYFSNRILKGTRISDLPVQQPAKLDLAINETTARLLKLSITPSVIARASHLVE